MFKPGLIYKVQRPLVSTDEHAPWLCYDEKRHHTFQTQPTKAMHMVMGNRYKVYISLNVDGKSFYRHEDQHW